MTKKKTVKELNEDVLVLAKRIKELEKIGEVFGKLSVVDLNELDKKIKLIQISLKSRKNYYQIGRD